MPIEIVRKDYSDEVVEDYLLGSLIDSNKIIAFRRSSGWVIIGLDPVRVKHTAYSGVERRKIIQGASFSMK